MALPLPKKTRQKLIDATAETICASRIVGRSRIIPPADMNPIQEAIHKGSELDQFLCSFLGEGHVSTFIRSELRSLRIGINDSKLRHEYFCDVFSRSQADAISAQLISSFESLPWTYNFTIELPGFGASALAYADGNLDLSASTRLVSGNRLDEADRRNQHPQSPSDIDFVANWIPAATYAQITLDGYVSADLQSETMLTAQERIFSLLGLFIAFTILETEHLWINGNTGRHPITVALQRPDGAIHLADFELDATYQTLANDLGYTTNFLLALESDEEIRSIFEKIKNALTNAPDHRLESAARWFFDSHAGSNSQVKFVQVMIAFEILLGDEKMAKETGLSTLMANRCAYMIGATAAQRTNIIEAFKEGYSIRSRIVHAGVSRLTDTEKGNFSYMQKLCCLVIQHEVNALRVGG
ncbi:HEPN domain-containing protein [Stenotrophomonas chelatiphaga]|uniref:HEPN domain-containing protein n=1 Tax=Stenotrophomonas chelatiphaga TaxID=517011 RepID=UPI000AB27C15|nr:HEPN domain-containing protein [Stenotrophomonas chelatiphaga]